MGDWKKAPPGLVAAFDAALPADERLVRRTMFGYPCAFVAGNMAAGLFADRVFVRVGEPDQAALARRGGRPFEPMAGRPMRGYFELPPSVAGAPGDLRRYLGLAIAHTASLPPKAPRSGASGGARSAKAAGAGAGTGRGPAKTAGGAATLTRPRTGGAGAAKGGSSRGGGAGGAGGARGRRR
jgi:TfoX/Sxy family transcriptional regulator of competence genes